MPEIVLDQKTWSLDENEILGRGGFGVVYAGCSPDGEPVALKVLPVGPPADRERLVAPGLSGRKNVLPILAHGQWEDRYVLAMPRADRSLRDVLDTLGGQAMAIEDAMSILRHTLSGLDAIGGDGARDPVVHRDLKPNNVLEYRGEWCVADFGIARYADATTGANTAKLAHTAPYTSPEQWRGDRVKPRTDIYSWAVMAVEVLTGQLPFPGPSEEDFREQHLTAEPPALTEMPDSLVALLRRCLAKQPAARPTAAEALDQLAIVDEVPSTPILKGLDRIERREVERQTREEAEEAAASARRERRAALAIDAANELDGIYSSLWRTLKRRMPSIVKEPIRIPPGTTSPVNVIEHEDLALWIWANHPLDDMEWGRVRESLDVIAVSGIALKIPGRSRGHVGSEYELWYCNPCGDDRYRWYEMAWSFTGERDDSVSWYDPKHLIPTDSFEVLTGRDVPWAVSMPLTLVDNAKFVERWCAIIVGAFEGRLPQRWLTLDPRSSPNIFLLTDGEE